MKTIGVLGGMGPAASVDFLERLVAMTPASCDQEHPPVLMYSASHVPDRTDHLEGRGPDPGPEMQRAAGVLEAAGADFLVMPCNTAHAYLGKVREGVSIPVLDMIGLAVDAICERHPEGASIGVLAATGTVKLGLYARRLESRGRKPLLPADQDAVMAAIRAVKGGRRGPDERLHDAIAELVERGAVGLILGCTELPLAVALDAVPVPWIDAGGELIRASLIEAGVSLE